MFFSLAEHDGVLRKFTLLAISFNLSCRLDLVIIQLVDLIIANVKLLILLNMKIFWPVQPAS